ncbi:MAG: WYL domain-containing protein, partial [Chloroflexota bacterium]
MNHQLVEAVNQLAGENPYPPAQPYLKKAFENDQHNLRHRLGVNFTYNPVTQTYRLIDPGPYGYFELSEQGVKALRLLSETFSGAMGETAEIQPLLDEIINRLSPEVRRKLERRRQSLDLDVFQGVDPQTLSPRVWETLHRAVDSHRKLAFHYLSPSQADRLPRYHEVAPYRLKFKRGHWYLYAYDLFWRNPYGEESKRQQHRNFRLNYILDDDKLQILPQVVAQTHLSPPRYGVHYRLTPPVGRGHISHHFDDMEIEQYEDGWAEVRGTTDDAWDAVRTLLGYGENCVVLGGAEVLRLMRQRVEGMARNYGFDA